MTDSARNRVAVVISCLLAACGGGSDPAGGPAPPPAPPAPPATEPVTGVFEAGGVQGLHYQTPTRSGFTNAAGQFSYLPGELVTFAIGGITLGSATGATQVTPFALFGATPPATESALRRELITLFDISGFDRAANVMLLLYALDRDRNGANGLDLTGLHAALAETELDLDLPLYLFAATFEARHSKALGIHRVVPVEAPLQHLYRALGIVVPVQAQSSSELTFEGSDSASRVVTGYDAAGQIVSHANDAGADGVFEYITRYSWSGGLQINTAMEPDLDMDGVLDRRQSVGGTRNERGQYLTYHQSDDYQADGTLDWREDTAYTYDAAGVLLSEVQTVDVDADGAPESRSLVSHVVDAKGNILSTTTDIDAMERVTQRFTYDAKGNRLTDTIEHDFGVDGQIDSRTTNVYTYDARGNVLTREIWGETAPYPSALGLRETYTYDARNNRLSALYESQFNNSVPELSMFSTATYDAHNNMLTQESRDRDVDGSLRAVVSRTFSHGAMGRSLAWVYRFDADGDGILNQVFRFSDTYGANGEKLTETETDEYPDPPGETSVTAYSYDTRLDDGLLYLLRHYQQEMFIAPQWLMY